METTLSASTDSKANPDKEVMIISLSSFIRCVLRLLLATTMMGAIGCSTVSNSESLPVFAVAENSPTTLAALTAPAPVEITYDLPLEQSLEQVLEMEAPLAIAPPSSATSVEMPSLPLNADAAAPSASQQEAIRRALVLAELKKGQTEMEPDKEEAQIAPLVPSELTSGPNPRIQSLEWNRNPLR